MQLVDSKLYIANMPSLQAPRDASATSQSGSFVSRIKATSASARLLVLMLAALVVAASPALIATVRSTVAVAFQIFVQAGHFGLIAFQIFGR